MTQPLSHNYASIPGLDMHYVRQGNGSPLMLVHGWPEFWGTWKKNIPVISQSHDVIAPDLRGFGDTSKPDDVPPVDQYAEDLIALLDVLGLERVGLVGHDVGGFVMQGVARRIPERISGLFFFNCPHPGIGSRWVDNGHYAELWYQSFQQKLWAADLVGYNRDTCRIYFSNLLAYWSHGDGSFEDDLEQWVDNFMKPGNLQGGFNWYRAVDEFRTRVILEGPPQLDPITIPTRVLWGRHDPVLLAGWAEQMREYFTDITIGYAEDAGHFVHYESPDLVNQEVLRFFGDK